MDTDSFQRQCDIDPIIDEELRSVRDRLGLHFTPKSYEFAG
jgi:hypothetical protein